MSRARAPVPTSKNFHARITPGEWRAVETMILRHGEARAKLGEGGTNANAWFRMAVRRMAAEQGITIVEDEVAPPPAPAEAPPPKAKRARA